MHQRRGELWILSPQPVANKFCAAQILASEQPGLRLQKRRHAVCSGANPPKDDSFPPLSLCHAEAERAIGRPEEASLFSLKHDSARILDSGGIGRLRMGVRFINLQGWFSN